MILLEVEKKQRVMINGMTIFIGRSVLVEGGIVVVIGGTMVVRRKLWLSLVDLWFLIL